MPKQPLPEELHEPTPQQQSFVTDWITSGKTNATQSALNAGYSPRNAAAQASRLLKKANIQALIKRKEAAIAVRTEYSHAQWLADVRETTELAKLNSAYGPALKGYELIGRHIGALTTDRGLSADDKKAYSWFGAMMQKHYGVMDAPDAEMPAIESEDTRA